jgi:hypothetical protein
LALAAGLGAARAAWAPVPGNIMTRWAAQVSPTNAHPEYPRPQMTRPDWLCLNGLWQFSTATASQAAPVGQTLAEQILVPYPVESALSGLKRHESRMWYRRTFDVPAAWSGQRVLIHFGAVDWQATVVVNGKHIGGHRGGFTGFSFDITSALKPAGPQEIIVGVYDPTDTQGQPRGKQVLNPNGIWYTPSSGIWQTVWLEPVPNARIDKLKIVPDVDAGVVRVNVKAVNSEAGDTVHLKAMDGTTVVSEIDGAPGKDIALPVPNAKLWSPASPTLYDLTVTLNHSGAKADKVGSYFGMRKIALGKDARGITRPLLNGQFVFQVGPLDQGFWPDGLLAAPTDDALKYDLEVEKQLGFNMVRKHIKVEPDRWYYWCDKLGLMVWQDMVSGNNDTADWKIEFEKELVQTIDAVSNHPCIVTWVVFNEGWGQFDTERLTARTKQLDPTRLVNNATGWTDRGVGDMVDWHVYPGPGSPNPEPTRMAVLGEFGGLGLVIDNHLWNTGSWSYAGYPDQATLTQAFLDLWRGVYRLRDNPGLSAVVYTQTTDVEVEINGLMTYDRAVIKMDPAKVKAYVTGNFPPPPVTILPTAETKPAAWKYVTVKPAANWFAVGFGDSSWSSGASGFGTAGTPGAIIGTTWNTNDIWIRRTFNVDAIPAGTPVLRLHHDEDCEVYVNGVLAIAPTGYVTSYQYVSMTPESIATLHVGANTIAIHCHQTVGGQYIDAGISVMQE